MLHRMCFVVLLAGSAALAWLSPSSALAQEGLTDARVALHVVPYVSTKVCGVNAPTNLDCRDFNTGGSLDTGYTVYVVVGRVPTQVGLKGISFGVDFDGTPYFGIDALGWTRCADLDFPSPGWPAPDAGITSTWGTCRANTPVLPSEWGQAVVGAFRVIAYDPDFLTITGRNNVSEPHPYVADCTAAAFGLEQSTQWAAANFNDAGTQGYNSCGGDTWCMLEPGRIAHVLNGSVQAIVDSFVVRNVSTNEEPGIIGSACSEIEFLSGGGAYTLLPGEEHPVVLRFTPSSPGSFTCAIATGCRSILFSVGVAQCLVKPDSLDFGALPVGAAAQLPFYIWNPGGNSLQVNVRETCDDFAIVSGGGQLAVAPGDTHTVLVEFNPQASGYSQCVIETGTSVCSDVFASGSGTGYCQVAPESVDFGSLPLGEHRDTTITIANLEAETVTGNASLDCPEFLILSGEGPFSLAPGEQRVVVVRFEPQTVGGKVCDLNLGACLPVPLVGNALPARCEVDPTVLDFGVIQPLETVLRGFLIRNPGSSFLDGVVSESCPAYSIVAGGGPYSIPPGDSLEVTVQFSPPGTGVFPCTVFTGASCSDVSCSGEAKAACQVSPVALDFGSVPVGQQAYRSALIRNSGPNPITGDVIENCGPFAITAGGGPFTLAPGESLAVVVRFAPVAAGNQNCTIQPGYGCSTISATGTGAPVGGQGSQAQAVIALHAVLPLNSKWCTPATEGGNAPNNIDCEDFVTQGAIELFYHVYVVVANADPSAGVAGVSFGLVHDANDYSGVEALQWLRCADLEFPSTGWPSPSAGLTATWSYSTNCQAEVPPGASGAQAVVGALEVIAYNPDILVVTGRNNIPEPNPFVADCTGASSVLRFGHQRGVVGFGGAGFNPCRVGIPAPVQVTDLVALRDGATAVLSWRVAGGEDALFHVRREAGDGSRIRVSTIPLTGTDAFRFEDPKPPSNQTAYWIEALKRDGTTQWFGPVILEAATTVRFPLLANRPNPFRSGTEFLFRTETEGNVVLSVFDLAGREVARVQDGAMGAGEHRIGWEARDVRGLRLRAGVYLYRLTRAEGSVTRKLVLMP